jgi:hypothetical protein
LFIFSSAICWRGFSADRTTATPKTKNTDKDKTKAQFVFLIDPIFASGDLRKLKSSPFRKHDNRGLVKSGMEEVALRVREDQTGRKT